MKRIERIIRIINDEEEKASVEMVACRKVYDDHIKMLNDLYGYEQEYKNNFSVSSAAGIKIERLQNYNNFMSRLEMTTKQQTINVKAASDRLDTATLAWQLKRQDRCSLEKLNVRLDDQCQLILARREQIEQDEMSSVQFQRNGKRIDG